MGLTANLKRLTEKKRWSQTQLTDHIGSPPHINRIETGKYNPSLDVVQKLAKAFDVTIDYPVSDTAEDLQEVRIEDKNFVQRVKLIDDIEEDKVALMRGIDSMPTKKQILHLITQKSVTAAQCRAISLCTKEL
jgi:transcriptional regulator with XRE-family HTH domain